MKKTKKLNTQQKKERLLIAVLCIVALGMLLFCVKAATKEPSDETPDISQSTGTTSTVVTTTMPTTTVPSPTTTTAPEQQSTQISETTTQVPEVTTTQPVVVDETQEILKVVSDSVNLLKSPESDFTGHKVQNINISLVDSSVPSMNDFVNSIIKIFVKEEIYDYDFTNGVSVDPESNGQIDSDDAFPPGDKPFELDIEGVASAKKEADGENTVYTIVVVPETSTLENPRPPHHNSAADTLDLSSVEIPIVTITKVDFEYPGAEISVTLDADGKVVGYHEHLQISGTGEANGLGISGYGTIEGYIDEKWDIKWK